MKIIATLITVILISTNLISQELSINTKNATVEFEFISEQAKGKVSGLEAKIVFNPLDLNNSYINGSVDVSTLTTFNEMRDKHLQKSDMFDAKKFPKMTFKSTSFSKSKKGFKAKGSVTIKGTSKETEFDFIKTQNGIAGKMTVFTNDFNVFPKKNRDDSKVIIAINLPFESK